MMRLIPALTCFVCGKLRCNFSDKPCLVRVIDCDSTKLSVEQVVCGDCVNYGFDCERVFVDEKRT